MIMIYWVTETINSSARLYYEFSHHGGFFQGRVDVPSSMKSDHIFRCSGSQPAII
jgi:hypothetical protein